MDNEKNVIDLSAARVERDVEELKKSAREFPGFKYDLDMMNRKIVFSGNATGGKDDTRLRVIAYDVTDGVARALGAFALSPEQFEALKRFAEPLLKAHAAAVADDA